MHSRRLTEYQGKGNMVGTIPQNRTERYGTELWTIPRNDGTERNGNGTMDYSTERNGMEWEWNYGLFHGTTEQNPNGTELNTGNR